MTTARAPRGASASERILLHTDRSGDCWLWTGATSANGYGRMTLSGASRTCLYAHRVSYETFVGPIAPGMQIDHLCRVRNCVNPHHLEQVEPQTNVLRGFSPGALAQRRDLCMYGHPYDEHGVIRSGRRICRLCQNTYMRLYNQLPHEVAMRRKRAGQPVVDLGAYFAAHRKERAA